MATDCTHVILVSRNDRVWTQRCERALRERGIESVDAHNCWSAELASQLHGGEAVVIDAHAVCDFVSIDRPGPVLAHAPKLPVVVFNAQELKEEHRSAAMAHNALMMDGDDVGQIARRVDDMLSSS